MATLDSRAGQLAKSQARLKKALEVRPGDAALTELAARVEVIMGNAAAARQMLEKIVQTHPDYLQAYEDLGQMYVKDNNLGAAQTQYEAIVKRDPNNVAAQTMVGMLHQVSGRTEPARAAFKRVLEINPRAVVANNNLAYMYAEEETNLDMALQMAQTAKIASPDDADVNDTLGWVYYKKGMPDQAISALQHAIQVKPTNPLYHFHLAMAYVRAGQRPQARTGVPAGAVAR